MQDLELQTVESKTTNAEGSHQTAGKTIRFSRYTAILVFGVVSAVIATISTAFIAGQTFERTFTSASRLELPPELLHATATHGGLDMAVATGQIDEDSEGIYFLDFKTGDLSCFIYYPRFQRFGGKFVTNVTEQLAATKNPEYLLVTGRASTPAISSNNRPALSLVYVVDTKSGQFAAYGVAVNRTVESNGRPQGGPMVFVDGGEIRPPSAGTARRSIPEPAAPANAAPANPVPGAPAAPVDPRRR